jgi:hypothetical protein
MSPNVSTRFTWRHVGLAVLAGATVVAWKPGVTWALGSAFAAVVGCEASERGIEPCLVNGHDYGPALYQTFVGGWDMVAAFAVMSVTLAAWIWIARRWLAARRHAPAVSA